MRFWFAYRVHVDVVNGSEPSLTVTLDLFRQSRRDRSFVTFCLDNLENSSMCLHCMPRKPRSLLEWLCDFAVVETLGRTVLSEDSGLENFPWLLLERNGTHWTERVLRPCYRNSRQCVYCGCLFAAESTVRGDPLRRVRLYQNVGVGRPHDENGVRPGSGLVAFQM